MATAPSFTPNLGLILLTTGSQAGVWGATTNGTFGFIDSATDGSLSIPLSASAYTLVTNQNAASNGRNKVIEFTGTLFQTATIIISPTTAQKLYFISNHTIGGFSLIIQQGSGPTYTIHAGHSAVVYANGAGPTAGVIGFTSDLQVDNLLVSGPFATAQPATFAGGVTISPSLALNLGGDQPFDMYYRTAAGTLARLPIGTPGELLEATPSGPQWAAGIGIGISITGGAPDELLYLDAALTLRQSPLFAVTPGVGLGIGIAAPQHPLHVGGVLNADCWLDSAAGTERRVIYASSGVPRVGIGLTTDAEAGGSAGSNFAVQSYNDPATAAYTHLACFRATGHTTVGAYADLGAVFSVVNTVPAGVAVVVRAAPGQTGDLQEWQGADGSTGVRVDAIGNFFFEGSLSGYTGLLITGSGEFVGINGVDTHGGVAAGEYAVYDSSGFRHAGYNGYVTAWGSGTQLLVYNGLVVG